MKYTVCIKADGSQLEDAKTLDDAIKIVEIMEAEDEVDGQYMVDYYDIKEENNDGVVKWYSGCGEQSGLVGWKQRANMNAGWTL